MKPSSIQKILDHHFPNPPIPLRFTNPYTFLIAVLLSAQCTDERVNKITPLLFDRRDEPEQILALGQEAIEAIIRPCGLAPTKSKAIIALSKILIENYESQVPNTFNALEALPGVGHKTASVIMSQIFNVPAFPVDTHIHRLAKRWGLSNGSTVKKTEEDLKKAFPKKSWNKLHLQMIYFARKFCPAKNHDRNQCPICSFF